MPNTVEQNLQRLVAANDNIAAAIKAKGGTVPTGDGLEEFAADISTIAPYEMTGELPLTFKSDGENLRDYAVKGKNVRTAQLLFKKINNVNIGSNGKFESDSSLAAWVAQVEANKAYILSGNTDIVSGYDIAFFENEPTVSSTSYNNNREVAYSSKTFRPPIDGYVACRANMADTEVMLNAGSTALPYEPYYDGIGERTKNLLPMTVAGIKAANTDGTWSGDVYTVYGVTFDVKTDSTGNVTGILVNGTPRRIFNFDLVERAYKPITYWGLSLNTPYYLNGAVTGGNVEFRMDSGGPWGFPINDDSGEVLFTFTDADNTYRPLLHLTQNNTVNNCLIKPMIRLVSVTDSTFEPYGYKIPITCGNTTTKLYIPDKLYEGDTLTYAQTDVDIPTVDGVNTLDTTLDTKFSMDIQYGDFPIYDNINAAINTLKGTDTTYKPADMADEILNAIPDVEVTGSPVTLTDAAAYPAEKLEFAVEPVQEGSGDPSPENVRPISGWTGVQGKHSGADTTQYTEIPITFPTEVGTVYGGKVDVVNGKLLAYPEYDSYNGETLTGAWISSMDAYVKGTTPTIGAQVVDLSGVGTEYDITPQQVQMLLSDNNIWCDTGNTTLKYKVDLGRFIAKLQAAQATPQLSLTRQTVSLDAPIDVEPISVDERTDETPTADTTEDDALSK